MTDVPWLRTLDSEWLDFVRHWDRREYLDAVDAGRRVVRLELASQSLLRKADKNRTQVRRMRRLAAELAEQVREQMRAQRRRRFRSPVAVRIELLALDLEQPPGTAPSVKAYLDLLQGLVYDDDRDVHLVHAARHASDNPLLRDDSHGWIWDLPRPRFPVGPLDGVRAAIEVLPLRLYAAGYDALWHRRDEVFDRGSNRFSDADGAAFFPTEEEEDPLAGDRLDDLRQEQHEDLENAGPLYGPGGLYDRDDESRAGRTRLRIMREQQIKSLENRLLLGQRLGPADRPGAPLPGPWNHTDPYAGQSERRLRLPGVLRLPLPSQIEHPSRYMDSAERMLNEHAERFRSIAFDTPIALDIAVCQPTEGRKDLDNLAHALMAPYERVFCAGAHGTITSYRVYISQSKPPGVRVLILPDARLEALPRAMESTRRWVLAERPHLRD